MGGYQEPPTHSPPSPPNKVGGKYDRGTYQKALELHSKGHSISEISIMLDVPRPTLHDWILGGKGRKAYTSDNKRYTLREYFEVIKLYREHYTPMEICRLTGVPRNIVWGWCIYGKRPKDIEALNIQRFNRWIEKHHPYKKGPPRILYNTTNWPYMAYLLGATLTDGTLFEDNRRKSYTIRITGEEIFLERVNNIVYSLIRKKYSIYPDRSRERHVLNITNKDLYTIVKQGLKDFKSMIPIIEYRYLTMKMFLLGLVDGDGFYSQSARYNRYVVGFLKSRRYWLVSYSAYLLRKLGIPFYWSIQRNKGKQHRNKYGDTITRRRNRFGWCCSASNFLRKIGATIKILKREDLHRYIKEIIEESYKDN